MREDSVLLDLSGIDYVHVDAWDHRVSMGPGVRVGELIRLERRFVPSRLGTARWCRRLTSETTLFSSG